MPKMKRTDPSTLGPKYIESRDAVKDVWGERKPFRGFGSWPSRVDYNLVVDEDQVDEWKASACVMCSIGCGIDIAVKDKKIVGVRGREHDRVNRGRLGPKGMYAWQSMASKDRLTHPLIRNKTTGELEKATWDEAMSLIVEKAKDVQKRLTSHGIGFYTSGQLFLEEYVTLACIGKAGLGTLHMDGNTRLCTATAAATMRESFGVDAQPSSYADIDECDVLCLLGHNPAETGTILWDRMLDRLESETPPKLVCIDPRHTAVAAKATIWLQPKNGTNMALMNGIQRELVKNGWYDQAYIDRCVVDFEHLKEVIEPYTPEYVEKITDVPAGKLRAAAKIMGEAERLLSTCLQGVYQANQATATGCQLNNIALMRGMIGKPGAGVLQMNGQPTAQNNRESGCDGEYPAMRNFNNPEHMASLAKAWNIELDKLPYHGNPTHINDLYNFLENGSIEMFWISCTNPLVSMTDTDRMRRILTQPNLFVVTQDIFPNETTQIADVVLPAAGWGEKHGTFTNVDRTVHISEKATEPPGEARADLDIFIDFATRMDFRDKDGNPLIHYKTPEGAFEMWRKVTYNMICDYSGISYEKLRHTGSGGIQWPCNEVTAPNGTVRMYSDGVFPTTLDKIQTWTSDCETGVPLTKEQFLKLNPNGKAIFKASPYYPYEDMPDEQYPLAINPGRRTAHFHTRTKTSRTEALHRDLPEVYGEINPKDAEQYGGIKTGDEMIIRSRHGEVQVKALVSENVSPGQIFIPFHFGNYDSDQYGNRAQCANELTKTSWDPISKQPHLKSGAAYIEKVPDGQIKIHSKQPEAMERARIRASGKRDELMKSENRVRHLEDYLGLWGAAIKAWREMATQIHKKYESTAEYEIVSGLPIMLILEERARKSMEPLTVRYGENEDKAWTTNIGGVVEAVFPDHRRNDKGSFNIMLDLHGLNTLLHMARGYIGPILPAIKALHDNSFAKCITGAEHEYERIDRYLTSQSTVRGPQVLIVPALPSAGSL